MKLQTRTREASGWHHPDRKVLEELLSEVVNLRRHVGDLLLSVSLCYLAATTVFDEFTNDIEVCFCRTDHFQRRSSVGHAVLPLILSLRTPSSTSWFKEPFYQIISSLNNHQDLMTLRSAHILGSPQIDSLQAIKTKCPQEEMSNHIMWLRLDPSHSCRVLMFKHSCYLTVLVKRGL